MSSPVDRFVVHPRIGNSLRFRPTDEVMAEVTGWSEDGNTPILSTEALRIPVPVDPLGVYRVLTVLAYLLQYDFRGSNRFQEEENLTFLRYYFLRYPEVSKHFRDGILDPTDWED